MALSTVSYGQIDNTEEVQLSIGDTLFFDNCNGENYQYIDFYKKTRFEGDKVDYDTLNGEEFYAHFFNTGDFDVTRLPCSFKNSYGTIKHMMTVDVQDGQRRNIIVLMVENGVTAAHVVEEAFINEEVLYVPRR